MKINVKQRIISGITALSIFSSALFPAATVFSEEMPSSEPETSVVETTPETAGTDTDASETSGETVTEYTDETESDTESSVEESTSEEESSEQSESETTAPVTTTVSDEADVIFTDNNFSCSDTDTDISLTVNNGMYILDDGTDIAMQDVSFVADAISVDDYIYQLDVDRRVKCIRTYNMKFEYDYHRVVAISDDVTVKYTFTEDVPEEEASSVAVYTVQSGVWTQISTDAPVIEYGYVKSVSFRATLPELDMFCVVWTDPESVKPNESILSSDRNYYYSDFGIEATATAFTGAICIGEPDEGSEGAEYGALPENANNIELTLDVLDEYDERRSLFDIKDGETVSVYSTRFFSEKYHNVTVSDYETEITYTLSEPVPEDKAYSVMAFVPGTEHMTLLPSEKIIDNGYITAIRFTVKDGIFAVFENISLNILTVSAENEYTITVKYDKGAGIPDGAELSVSEENADYYLDDTADALGWTDDDYICYTLFFDIAIMCDGIEYEPQTPVIVTADLHDATEAPEALQVVHIDDEGASEVEIGSAADAQITFAAESFSVYGFGSALHTVLSENNGTTELSVFSALSDSGISAAPMEINALTEGLETENAFGFTVTDSASVGKLWIMANVDEGAELDDRESFSVYSVYNNEASIVLIPDITENEGLCPVGLGVNAIALIKDTGFRRTSLDIKVDGEESGKSVTMDGMMPKAAQGQAIDVTGAFAGEYAEHIEDKSLLAAYDLSIFEKTEAQQETPAAEDAVTDGTVPAESITGETSENTADTCLEESSADVTSESIADTYPEDNSTDVAYGGTAEGIYEQQTANTAARQKYQPGEERPVHIEITDPRIVADEEIILYHISDDGTTEEITDFTIEDGKIGFEAVGFSVYQIVEAKTPFEGNMIPLENISDLTGDNGKGGFYLYLGSQGKYSLNEIVIKDNKHYCLKETTEIQSEAIFYFEQAGNDSYYIYTYDSYGNKLYLYNTKDNQYNEYNIELRKDLKNEFYVEKDGDKFRIYKYKDGTNTIWYLQHSNGGGGVRFHENRNTNGLFSLYFANAYKIPDDYYKLNGETYGIMNYSGGATGYALMAIPKDANSLNSSKLTVKSNILHEEGYLYVASNSDITMWTFHSEGEDKYRLSTIVNGNTQYLKINNSGLSMTSSPEDAAVIRVISGEGGKAGKIRLVATDNSKKAVSYTSNAFKCANDGNANSLWMNLAKLSDLTEEDFVTYTAQKVSVSDTTNVHNHSKVVVYTRIWNDDDKEYEFYAIDHAGNFVRCFESGDNIGWVGSRVNDLLWEFSEYYYEDTDDPNWYYDLQNTYSGKFLAPQMNQVLSDEKIGINMQGRREGQYYTTIVAWDDPWYTYAGLHIDDDTKELSSSPLSKADTFYFAVMTTQEYADFNTIDTVSNSEYGITMKMIDFNGTITVDDGTSTTQTQHDFIGETKYIEMTGSPGLVKTNLTNGYPTTTITNKSFSELFGEAQPVDHLFIESTHEESGYFEYDSCQNFATLDGRTSGDFKVYSELGTMDSSSKNSLKHGQFMPYNNITPGNYVSKNNKYNLYDVKQNELSNDDPRKNEQLYLVENPNYCFGMELSASFTQTPDGKDAWGHDIIFEFTGDDDFWLFVDGELVIDLGGIHRALEGNVNFATGKVNGNPNYTTLYEIFYYNYLNRDDHTEADAQAYVDSIFELKKGNYVFRNYTAHDMKIYYMERGSGASNLHMRFNLSSVKPGQVLLTKKITGTDDVDYDLVEYPFQIYYKETEDGGYQLLSDSSLVYYPNSPLSTVKYKDTYTMSNGLEYASVFFLHPEQSVAIQFPMDTISYYIKECGINKQIYDETKANSVTISGTEACTPNGTVVDNYYDYEIEKTKVSERTQVVYSNHVDPDALRKLYITKRLYDENDNELTREQDDTVFSFRLALYNDILHEYELTNKHSYYILNPQREYCKWDYDSQRFVSIGKTSDLTDEEKEMVTFHTSINGAISKIPAQYTVVVPDLIVGTEFMVEERSTEIPIGYKFKEYYRGEGSYYIAGEDTYNTGTVRANSEPSMEIHNKRGYGLTANKIWSDADFVDGHDSIYLAVYIKGSNNSYSLLTDSVRKLIDPKTSVYWYFDNILSGHTFSDYEIREVELTGDDINVDSTTGNVTGYTDIRPINENSFTSVGAKQKEGTSYKNYAYTVTYEHNGDAKKENLRTGEITNTRGGGVQIKIGEWNGTNINRTIVSPLSGGVFTLVLEDKNGNIIADYGEYTSLSNGIITTLYDYYTFDNGDNVYVLTETHSPTGYVGLNESVKFYIEETEDGVDSEGNTKYKHTIYMMQSEEDGWSNHKEEIGTDKLIGYVNIYNKNFTLKVVKYNGNSDVAIDGVEFVLYKEVVSGDGTLIRDYRPIPGYSSLITGADGEDGVPPESGVIPKINRNLPEGIYYLVEKTALPGFKKLDGDIRLIVDELGYVYIDPNHCPEGVTMGNTVGSDYKCDIRIPNAESSRSVDLTITKIVDGTFGEKQNPFSIKINITDSSNTPYKETLSYAKGDATTEPNVENAVDLMYIENTEDTAESGYFVTLTHNEKVTIYGIPAGYKVTFTETNAEGYTIAYSDVTDNEHPVGLDYLDTEKNSTELTMNTDKNVKITNTLNGVIPTGAHLPEISVVFAGFLALGVIFLARRERLRVKGDDDES